MTLASYIGGLSPTRITQEHRDEARWISQRAIELCENRDSQEFVGQEVHDALVIETNDLLVAREQDDISAVGHVQRIHIGYGYRMIRRRLFETTEEQKPSGRRAKKSKSPQ
ncbi:hypothetical protein [Ruegeria sp. 6PALISEP08]|uniref:hypothetical protein n=1 Tax=Ruegeria sp. 6PALISEP08 TaxID=1225660 RepID=UPI00067F638E|nr:hypothetical protein [Ruegeria sp. 6PALISEP08]